MLATADLLGHEAEVRVPKGSIPRWVARYGYGTRQIKNWLAKGREVGELPPFEQPEKMADWAGRYLGKVPGRLQEAIDKLTGAAAEEKAPETVEHFEIPDVSQDAMGVEADLHRFRHKLAVIHRMHDDALREKRFSEASRLLEQAREVSGEVRQLEKLLPAVKEASGEWMRTAETQKHTMAFLTVLQRALLGRGAKAAAKLRACCGSDADLVRAWRDEVSAVFAECCENKFEESLVLE